MSTDIDDLPGPSEEYEQELPYEQPEEVFVPLENYKNVSPNISVAVKKRHSGHTGHIGHTGTVHGPVQENFTTDIITNQFNQNNLLVLAVIYLATLPITSEYTRKFLSLVSLANSSSTVVTFIKCVILLLLYIIIRDYVAYK
jgi:hypothetical protein